MPGDRGLALLLTAALAATLLAGCSSSSSSDSSDDTTAAAAETTAAGDETEAEGETTSGSTTDYPTTTINGIVQWGEGGGTDSLMRPLSTLAQDILGQSIVIQNKTGGTGSIATQYVYDQDADGYNLLMGAENPALYDVLGISDLTYDNFECVFLIGDETTGVVVAADSPYSSLTEIVDAALAGENITLATTGTGGLPWEVAALITSITSAEFTQVQYDSDASAKTAVLGGECDFTICKVQTGIEEYTSGDLKWLCVLSTETVELMSDVPLVTEEYPDFEQYLPWGPFYGIFVEEGTDSAIIETLSAAFAEAYEDASYQEVLDSFYINALGYTGDEATAYIDAWRTNMIDALTNAGAIE
ncbi:MAG: tripartite tricarboxylate transporter substrate binding protein [Lachnospiraceae bacterium]|nr:tripartite tricarboxylate transporter substrate binding protein [Lachnospiraceae bacterium]